MPAGSREPPRYITPEALLRLRFGSGERPRWDVGILCFRGRSGSEGLARALGARPVRDKTVSMTHVTISLVEVGGIGSIHP